MHQNGEIDPRRVSARRPRVIIVVPLIFSRPRSKTRLDGPTPFSHSFNTTSGLQTHSAHDRLLEACGLARALDLEIVDKNIINIPAPRPGTLFGTGKVKELGERVTDSKAQLVIVDHVVSPIQQRNLELAWKTKVLDRTGLILEIFGARARTREGRLQVELAHLTYQKGRLVRAWTHLERQRGGSAFLGGPGEAQIELDRRMIDVRLEAIKRELSQVVKTRALHRSGRRKVPYPIVALVGYTNAGKSTLFNSLTGSSVVAQDQVFATLDPTMREVKLPGGRAMILSDTVGFISNLPTILVAAFRATLEEVVEADLIVHVRDISHPEHEAQCADVEQVLGEIGVKLAAPNNRVLEVWNKVDLVPQSILDDAQFKRQIREANPVLVSAISGKGMKGLLARIDTLFGAHDIDVTLTLKASQGKLRHWLFEHAQILEETLSEEGSSTLQVRLDPKQHSRLMSKLNNGSDKQPCK